MIDLHCHMLPAIDDGASNLDVALSMARLAVADGITTTVCTPHIYPGWFENTYEDISRAVGGFRQELDKAGIPLDVAFGADIQVVPDLVAGLRAGSLPTIGDSRFFLFEPPHNTSLPRLPELLHAVLLAGYTPIITHPERLGYIEQDYDTIVAAARAGAWIQLTGGSLLGVFGRRVKAISERFLQEGVVHLLASDGHNLTNRAPVLSEAREAAAALVGVEEASRLVSDRPAAVIADAEPSNIVLPPGLVPQGSGTPPSDGKALGWLKRLMSIPSR